MSSDTRVWWLGPTGMESKSESEVTMLARIVAEISFRRIGSWLLEVKRSLTRGERMPWLTRVLADGSYEETWFRALRAASRDWMLAVFMRLISAGPTVVAT